MVGQRGADVAAEQVQGQIQAGGDPAGGQDVALSTNSAV